MLSYCCACLFFLLLFLWLFARLVVCPFTWSTRTSHRSVVGGSGPGWLFVTVTHCGFVGAEYLDWIAADAILYPHTILYQVVLALYHIAPISTPYCTIAVSKPSSVTLQSHHVAATTVTARDQSAYLELSLWSAFCANILHFAPTLCTTLCKMQRTNQHILRAPSDQHFVPDPITMPLTSA